MQLNSLKINNKIINDSKSIANKFSDFFGSITNTINVKTPKLKTSYKQYLRHSTTNSLPLNTVTEKEIEKVINNFRENKAAALYSIPTRILKEFKKPLSVPLIIIINVSYMTGTFPEFCKIVHVTPVFKKGDQLDSSNWQSISLLSNIKKSLTKQFTPDYINFQISMTVFTKNSLDFVIHIQQTMLLSQLLKKWEKPYIRMSVLVEYFKTSFLNFRLPMILLTIRSVW